ncbi:MULTISPECIES: MmyB family transcriptional regulator [Streptomyces]|uniref:MmyB family transcriptional regulator n=1 Tax=Streptomyces TaxID=1883 RepID=UPI002248865E|nr:XRE family transcriptional regulator [Streptomyces sp. JHD 1]MCX2969416.1 XRE family transcriptional regulator [Streptomyces sp. JHD 1]
MIDGEISITQSVGDHHTRHGLQRLLDHQLPDPAYLTDKAWNVAGYNAAMVTIWPWVREPGANLMRWALLGEEARTQYVNWEQNAVEYVKLLRFAGTRYPHDDQLLDLIMQVKSDAVCRQLWESVAAVSESRDGHSHVMRIPSLSRTPVTAVTSVLFPAATPEYRVTIITWADEELAAANSHYDAKLAYLIDEKQNPASVPSRQPATHRIVDTPQEVERMAGNSGLSLPALSSAIGGADCKLVVNQEQRLLLWASRHSDGRWDVAQLTPHSVLVRLSSSIFTSGNPQVREEYKTVVRYAFPENPQQAISTCEEVAAEMRGRIEAVTAVNREICDSLQNDRAAGRADVRR